MSDSVRPHRWQPTRSPRPWDSPGKNTGVGCHFLLQCTKVKIESEVAQTCLTLCDPMDCSPPGSSTHGIFRARVLEWVAIAFSSVSCSVMFNSLQPTVWVLWTVAHQAHPSMGFSRQQYWSGVPLPSPFTVIKRLFSSSSLFAMRVVSSAYLRLLMFPPSNLGSSLCFLEPSISHDVLCI